MELKAIEIWKELKATEFCKEPGATYNLNTELRATYTL